MKRLFTKMRYEVEKGHDLMLVSILSGSGSAPRGKGAQMLVSAEGRVEGTIGGGNVEYLSERAAMELLERRQSEKRCFSLHSGGEDIGMLCGGEIQVWMQFVDAGEAA